MKRLAILLFFTLVGGILAAQQIFRSEFAPYDAREDALNRDHSKTVNHIVYRPQNLGTVGDIEMFGTKIAVPTAWNDYNAYLHIENTRQAYDIAINGAVVASSEDPHTPADYFVTPYLQQGENDIVLLLRPSKSWQLNESAQPSPRKQFEDCYLYAQHRTSVFDYDAAIVERQGKLHLQLDIIADNSFNFQENFTVGYDIYTPERKLVDYAVNEVVVPGRSRDTLRVRVDLGAETRYLWSAAKPWLYRATIYLKRNGKPFEYIPVRIGAGSTTFNQGTIYRNGKPITIKSAQYNAKTTRAESRKDILALKAQGINTLKPDSPQPLWFYDLCDDVGLYVIERASINPTSKGDDRTLGGTPSNNPNLLRDYLLRVKTMYYRTRNHPCIIAYSLSHPNAGNGYCLYKAYQWLKSVESARPVICESAGGEWNTDM